MRNTQFRLFISYSALIVILFSLLLGAYYLAISSNLRESKKTDILNYSQSISETFDQQISQMNNASSKLVFSTDFKNNFYHNLNIPNDSSSVLAKRELTNVIYTVSGPSLPYTEINVINSADGKFFYTGQYTNYQILNKNDISSIPGLKTILAKDGKRVIFGPGKDPFGRIREDVFSVSRAFSEKYNTAKNSVIIVQQKYSILKNILNPLAAGNEYYIFDAEGNLFSNDEEYSYDFNKIFSLVKDTLPKTRSANTFKMDDIEYFAGITYSGITDYYVMVIANESEIITPFTTISLKTLIIGILLIIAALIASFFISRALTMPIGRIKATIESLQLSEDNRISFTPEGRVVTDLEWLDSSVAEVAKKLDSALSDILNLKTYEAEARLLAFQMQMGPHFLYNTLSIIGIHAQNGETEIAKQMCDDLCSMLRYIGSSGDNRMSTVEEELEHSEKYIFLMQRRYPDNILYDINVDTQILDNNLPILTIQPIVENCIKYGISDDGKWHIHIFGQKTDTGWMIAISDEGRGFGNSSEVPIVSTMIGLNNIHKRLDLIWQDKVSFEIGNKPEGGAEVRIIIYE